MAIEYTGFGEVAFSLLHSEENTEAFFRSSVSRAYYGFYHAALIYADSVSVPRVSDTRGPTHTKLSSYFHSNLHADPALRIIANRP